MIDKLSYKDKSMQTVSVGQEMILCLFYITKYSIEAEKALR